MTFFGSWLLAFDAAGQVRRDNDSPVLTLAAVAVPYENGEHVRTLLRRGFEGTPVKWRDGGLEGLDVTTKIIRSQTLPVAVTHMTAISADAWRRFWDEATEATARLRDLTGVSANFATGGATARLLLFAAVFAHCAAHVLKRRGWTAPAPPDRRDSVDFGAVFDTDIQDQEARSVLSETLRDWARGGRFGRVANLGMTVSGSFETEQDEPLVLLADYVAGSFNHAHPQAMIKKPVEPLDDVRKAVDTFRLAQGSRLQEVQQPFEEIYPLTKMWELP